MLNTIIKSVKKYSFIGKPPKTINELKYYFNGFPIIINSMPKSGTHLLIRIMDLLRFQQTGKFIEYYDWPEDIYQDSLEFSLKQLCTVGKRQFLSGHIACNEKIKRLLRDYDFKMLLILRDPRDVVISHIFHVEKKCNSKFHNFYETVPDIKGKIKITIVGAPEDCSYFPSYCLKNIKEQFDIFLPWSEEPLCHVAKFEDLIGEMGGGSEHTQKQSLYNILQHINFSISPAQLETVRLNCFSSSSPTFRKGEIGNWRNYFDEELKDIFKQHANDLLMSLGYESDDNW